MCHKDVKKSVVSVHKTCRKCVENVMYRDKRVQQRCSIRCTAKINYATSFILVTYMSVRNKIGIFDCQYALNILRENLNKS